MSKRRFSPARLAASALVSVLLVVVVPALYVMYEQQRLAEQALDAKLQAMQNIVVDVAGPSIALDDPAAVHDDLAHLEHDPDFAFAMAFDASGAQVAYSGPADLRATYAAAHYQDGIQHDGELVVAAYPVMMKDRKAGSITLGLHSARTHSLMERVMVRAALLSGVSLLAAIAIVLRLTRRLSRRNREMKLVLDSVDQGFLTVGADGVLAQERSAMALRLLGPPRPDEHLWDALARVDAGTAQWLALGWDALREGVMPLELCLDQLPATLVGGSRTYRLGYKPVMRGETLHDVLVVISDVTDELERSRIEAGERELVQVIEQLTRDRHGMVEFLAEAEQMLVRISAATEATPAIRRDLHTLKGNCAIYGLTEIAATCHKIEDQIEQQERLEPEPLVTQWRALRAKLERVFGPNLTNRHLDIDASDLEALRAALLRGASIPELRKLVDDWQLERVHARLGRFGEQARLLAGKLGKAGLEVAIDANGVRVDGERFRGFWSAFSHLVRNAVDHGIETADERERDGKPATAKLVLEARAIPGAIEVGISDDGRGVDWERLAERARARGLPAETHDDLVAALFSDGVTTRDEVSETSGRGVGLAAVRQACAALGASLDVDSEPQQGTRFLFRIPASRTRTTSGSPIEPPTVTSRLRVVR